MKASPIQPSFSGGEFSPKLQGRVDNERYRTGLAKSLNFLPTVQGPLVRRPGFKYVGNDVKDPSKPPSFIPFQFSQTQNYVIEVGDQYIRFYTNGGQVIAGTNVFQTSGSLFYSRQNPSNLIFNSLQDNPYSKSDRLVTGSSITAAGSILELTSPYAYTDAPNIKYAQLGDTLYLVCLGRPTYKLQRQGTYYWDLRPVTFLDGPYLPLNSYAASGDSADITLIPSNPTVPTITTGPSYYIQKTENNGQGEIRLTMSSALAGITTNLFVEGSRVAVRGVAGSTEANNTTAHVGSEYWIVKNPTPTTIDLAGSTYGFTITNSTGIVSPALFLQSRNSQVQAWSDAGLNHYRQFGLIQNGKRYFGIIYNVTNAATASAIFYSSMPNTSVISTWQLGPWSSNNGFPTAACFHQDRLALAGAAGFPQRFDLSNTSDYENFAPSNSSLVVSDNNAISFNTSSDQLNTINWIKSDTHGLLAGTAASEWSITPSSQNAALTPTNINARQTSFFGSYSADAVQAGNATLYIQGGQNRVREMNYFFQFDTYRSTDIAELADHLMLPGLSKLVNQKETIPIVWCLTSDGNLRSMTYSRDDQTLKVGWAQHQPGGQSDSSGTPPIIKSMAVITSSSGTFDQLWCATQRYINGTTVINVEYMSKIFDDQTNHRDAFFLDAGSTYNSPIAIQGISQAGSAIVTAGAHGLSDGDQIRVESVIGLNSSFVDTMGLTFNSNLVNGRLFRVGSTSASAFFLQDINNGSSYVDSRTYTPYFSGGAARKLVSNISGLTWLKNETVNILADGKEHPATLVNSAGVLSLQYKAAVVQIGYGYNSDGKTLRPEVGNAEASSIGELRRAYHASFMLHRAGQLLVGPSFDKLTPANFNTLDAPQADSASKLFSGVVRESIESEHDYEGQVCFRMNSSLPGMVQTVTVALEVNEG